MDYGRAMADQPLQQGLKNSISFSEVLLFVGTGAGLNDPNFGGLLAWAAHQNEGLAQRHCVLACQGECIDTTLNGLNVLKYGTEYEELPAFLKRIAQTNKTSHLQVS
ncbi:hypothetical protein F5883DRAFT_525050 [Diaporthe sp. PMI_573]|nr:hypothetical protein F5883DRAFT_525050 [Diaporthaceae sp. PMI_573]